MSNIDFIYENIDDALKKYVFTDTLHTKVVKMFMVTQVVLEELLGFPNPPIEIYLIIK